MKYTHYIGLHKIYISSLSRPHASSTTSLCHPSSIPRNFESKNRRNFYYILIPNKFQNYPSVIQSPFFLIKLITQYVFFFPFHIYQSIDVFINSVIIILLVNRKHSLRSVNRLDNFVQQFTQRTIVKWRYIMFFQHVQRQYSISVDRGSGKNMSSSSMF